MQFDLFSRNELSRAPSPSPLNLWLLTCEPEDADLVRNHLLSREHFLVDTESGQTALRHRDIILIRDPLSNRYEVVADSDIELSSPRVLSAVETYLRSPSIPVGEGCRELLLFSFGPGGLNRRPVMDNAGPLLRMASALRSIDIKNKPHSWSQICDAAMELIGFPPDPRLLAIIEREKGDALSAVLAVGQGGERAKQEILQAYQRASAIFRENGLSAALQSAQQQRKLFLRGNQHQLTFDFISAIPPRIAKGNWYCVRRILGRRLILDTGHAIAATTALAPALVPARRSIGSLDLSDRELCRLLIGAGSRLVRPWMEVLSHTEERLVFRAGLHREIAVLAGLAGHLPTEDRLCTVMPFCRKSNITPKFAKVRWGEMAEFVLSPPPDSRQKIHLDVLTDTGAIVNINKYMWAT